MLNLQGLVLCYVYGSFWTITALLCWQYRHNLFSAWCQHLTQAGLSFRPDIALTEYLSNPDDRLRWQANALPTDDLCTENAIMLKVL